MNSFVNLDRMVQNTSGKQLSGTSIFAILSPLYSPALLRMRNKGLESEYNNQTL